MLFLMFYKLIINYLFIISIVQLGIVPNLISLIIISQILNFFIPFVAYKIITKQKFTEILLLKPISIKNVILIICISIIIQPSIMLVSAVTSIFSDNNIVIIMQQLTDFPIVLGILAIGVTPAIFEELVFRGVIYNEYKKVNIRKAALVNGLLFGIMHMNLQQFFYATILGVLLTYLIYYTGSIFAPILFHFVINSSQVILGYIAFNAMPNIPIEEVPEASIVLSIIYTGVFALLCMPLLIFLFKEFVDENKHNIETPNHVTLESNDRLYKVNTWALKGVILFFVLYILMDYLL